MEEVSGETKPSVTNSRSRRNPKRRRGDQSRDEEDASVVRDGVLGNLMDKSKFQISLSPSLLFLFCFSLSLARFLLSLYLCVGVYPPSDQGRLDFRRNNRCPNTAHQRLGLSFDIFFFCRLIVVDAVVVSLVCPKALLFSFIFGLR